MVGFRPFINAVVAFLVITRARAADKSKMVTRVTDDGLLCISECATCPALCSPPSPPPFSSTPSPPLSSTPPPPSQIYVGHHPPPPVSPPKTTKSAPPPPFNYLIITSAPPPPIGGQKGAPSNPYYYFYTSDAWTSALSVSCLLKLFSWLVLPLFLFSQ